MWYGQRQGNKPNKSSVIGALSKALISFRAFQAVETLEAGSLVRSFSQMCHGQRVNWASVSTVVVQIKHEQLL